MNTKKIVIIALVGILLASTFLLAVESATGSPFTKFMHKQNNARWTRINGIIDQWGTTDVRGTLQTQATTAVLNASITKHFTAATAMWTTNTTRAITATRDKENFTYVYYVARLPNASLSNATASTGNYFLNGTWTLAQVTSTITVLTDANGTITKVHRDQDITPTTAYGELKITNNNFTLSINGQETLSGSVYRSVMRSWFNPFKITDDSANGAVSVPDVHAVVNCFGAMPGYGKFDTGMDFNHNDRVDISDVSTVAVNM